MAPQSQTQIFSATRHFQGFQRILMFRIPFPQLTSLLTSSGLPVLVLFIALGGYYIDYIQSRAYGFFKNPNEIEVFDFIVIGGGSAGSVVVNRLSEKYSVLLLEAGGEPHPFSYFPTTSLVTLNLPLIDWGYKTVPQEHACFALKNNVSQWPRGKALGGSSIQNIMMYMRGNPRDYNDWANITGDESWNYENVLKYFKKMEDYHGYGLDSPDSSKLHGTGGPMHIEKLRFSPSLDFWLEAGKELGYDIIDPNGYQRAGFSGMDVTMKNGRRFSTYSGYIRPIYNRRNLKIYKYAEASKIHFDDDKRAVGVTYRRHGITRFVKASKEVILSAGTVNSPKLLLLSGIGPNDHLAEMGIDPLVSLPVGKNLQDHIFTVIGPFLINRPESFVLDRDLNLKTFTDYFLNGSGPIVSIAGISGLALLPSSLSRDNYPDIYINHVGIGTHLNLGKEQDQTFGFVPRTMETYLAPHAGKDGFFASVNLGQTKSLGEIQLNSRNPFEYPRIDPKYLSHEDDVKVMIEGVKAAIRIYENTTTFQRLGAKLAENKYPLCEHLEFRSDAYFECYVRSYTLTVYHPCGTCRMGLGESDLNSVVDSQLRVLHTKNLRVIDASVIPQITNANINAAVIMLAEKGSDIVLKHWEHNDGEMQMTGSSTSSSNMTSTTETVRRNDGNASGEELFANESEVIPQNRSVSVIEGVQEEKPKYKVDPRRRK